MPSDEFDPHTPHVFAYRPAEMPLEFAGQLHRMYTDTGGDVVVTQRFVEAVMQQFARPPLPRCEMRLGLQRASRPANQFARQSFDDERRARVFVLYRPKQIRNHKRGSSSQELVRLRRETGVVQESVAPFATEFNVEAGGCRMEDAGMHLIGGMQRELPRQTCAMSAPPAVGLRPFQREAEAPLVMGVATHAERSGIGLLHEA